jgi:hypothetical protein
MHLLIDEILQAFEANGNLHFVFGASAGQVDERGHDLKEPVVTLIIPSVRAGLISKDLQIAVETLLKDRPDTSAEHHQDLESVDEFLGAGVSVRRSC